MLLKLCVFIYCHELQTNPFQLLIKKKKDNISYKMSDVNGNLWEIYFNFTPLYEQISAYFYSPDTK